MSENQSADTRWKNLLALSAPTFEGESTPPYGFVTSTLALLREERREREILERIGMRALFASLTAALAMLAFVVVVPAPSSGEANDLEPGLTEILHLHLPTDSFS